MTIRAGGAVFVSLNTKRICLVLRSKEVSNPYTWGFVGGKLQKNEIILDGIGREIYEELGFVPVHKAVLPIDVYKSADNNFVYYSVMILVNEEFTPQLNHENGAYGWFDIDCLPKPLHAGAKKILAHKDFKKNFLEILADNN